MPFEVRGVADVPEGGFKVRVLGPGSILWVLLTPTIGGH